LFAYFFLSVRNWNNPQLFGYPSPDRVHIAELKKEACNLQEENELLKQTQAIESLVEEIERL
jgi:hypothetical protein